MEMIEIQASFTESRGIDLGIRILCRISSFWDKVWLCGLPEVIPAGKTWVLGCGLSLISKVSDLKPLSPFWMDWRSKWLFEAWKEWPHQINLPSIIQGGGLSDWAFLWVGPACLVRGGPVRQKGSGESAVALVSKKCLHPSVGSENNSLFHLKRERMPSSLLGL